MELTESQRNEVAAWFSAGASLDEIQKRIKAEFGIHMTYLDVRLLVADLPQPVEAGKVANGEDAETAGRMPQDNGQEFADGPDDHQGSGREPGSYQVHDVGNQQENEETPFPQDDDACPEGQAVPAPTVTIDALMIPGTIASGDVTFSDGQTGKWFLDQMGRLGLGGDLPQGYRPSPTDAALFQQQLMGLLQSKGLC